MKPPKHLPKPVRKSGGAMATKLSDQMASSNVEFAASQAAYFDNYSVEQFAYAMRIKLAVKRNEGRGGWQDKEFCSGDFLSQLLREHVEKGDPIDVANFCMMLHQRGERISSSPQTNNVSAEEMADRVVNAIYAEFAVNLLHKAEDRKLRAAVLSALAAEENVNRNGAGSKAETPATCCTFDPNNDPKNENIQAPQAHLSGSKAIVDVVAERLRQQSVEGWSLGHDDAHSDGEMARAAGCYAYFGSWGDSDRQKMTRRAPQNWPWDLSWWKPTDRRRDLVKAAALLIAEIERVDRAALSAEGSDNG